MGELISKDISTKNVLLILLAAILIPLVASIPFLMNSYENDVSFSDKGMEVNGMGGFELDWDKVKSISLVDHLPKVEKTRKREAVKGDFKMQEDGSDLKLIINGDAPYIRIQTGSFDVYLNQYYQKETKKVFQEIQTAFKASKS